MSAMDINMVSGQMRPRTNSTNEHLSFVSEMDEITALNSPQQEEGDSERGRLD